MTRALFRVFYIVQMVGSIGSNDRLYRIYVLRAFGLGSIGFARYVSLGSEGYRFRRVRVVRIWCPGIGI